MFAVNFLILFAVWILLSGRFDAMHLGMGVFSAALVAFLSGNLLFQEEDRSAGDRLREVVRTPIYLLWLLWQITLANFHVLYLAFHPRMLDLIDPRLLEFKSSQLNTQFARFVFANSITLTPGTVTVRLREGVYTVHAISQHAAEGLPDPMEGKVAWAFNVKGEC